MKLLQTRRQIVLGLAVLVLIAAVVYGFVTSRGGDATSTYEGLVTQQDVDMDEETRFIFENRVMIFQAALAAQEAFEEQTGQRVDWDLYLEIASNANIIGDLATARENYQALLQLNPLHYAAWNNYGGILVQMKDFDAAEDAYLQAIDIFPTQEAYRDYVALLERPETSDRDEEVLEILQDGVRRLGQQTWFMVRLAQWYLEHDDCDQALAHYKVAMQLAPEREAIQKDYQEARASCR
ncbi:hypothetical protein IH979_01140 [Patescibacteria group bacterium]|nr:hypothetical protein [Patescibacteria group bacterium]